jgi:hypothetical protein
MLPEAEATAPVRGKRALAITREARVIEEEAVVDPESAQVGLLVGRWEVGSLDLPSPKVNLQYSSRVSPRHVPSPPFPGSGRLSFRESSLSPQSALISRPLLACYLSFFSELRKVY